MPSLVSAIIPTYNRARDVRIAVATALQQTYQPIELIVVDDGSTDGTAEALRREFGDRLRILAKPNGGVSSARNAGLAAARGEYLALLDSDDEWLPTHVEAQVAFLESHPDFGMVLTDVVRMDSERRDYELYRRREFLPEDGYILPWVLRNPSLVPASAAFRRVVYEDVGGFDETLRTAEDLDFHLRVARRWKVGVIEQPLTRAMRGHDGLSASAQTCRDYLAVVEGFVERHRDQLEPSDRDAALLHACARNARGLLSAGNNGEALRCAARGTARIRSAQDAAAIWRMYAALAKAALAQTRQALRGRAGAGPRR
jgi:glycosyltransferase involved in cell wall biosynthesis